MGKQKIQVIMLYTSSLLGVLLGILSSIVNTRFLTPTDYGDVRYIQNLVNFIASFLLFGYFLSGSRLMALSTDLSYTRRIKGMMVVILALAGLALLLSMPLCYLFHLDDPHLATLFLITMPVCLVPLLFNYIEQTAQGDNQIGRLSLTRLLPYLIYVPTAYLIYKYTGATSRKMLWLQWGIYSTVYLSIIISTRPKFTNLAPVWETLKTENHSYGIQLYIGSLVMVATNYLAGISLGFFNSDNSEVGFYTLALTVTSPLATLPAIVGTTYFKKFASQPCIPNKVLQFTALLTLGTCIVFLLIIQPVVTYLYTERYAIVGIYASVLSIAYCIHGYGDMLNRYLGSHGQGKAIRNASIANGIFKIIGFTLLVALFNTKGAIATVIVCDIIYFGSLIWYYRKFVGQNETM